MMILTRAELIATYTDRQHCTPADLETRLRALEARYTPDGFFLAECQMMDSSRFGELIILPYGPANTFKAPPDRPFSPRGLASDMSVVVGICPIGGL